MVPLKEVLQDHFGEDFPVGAGTTKRDDPLVITDKRDHVSIEYGVARFLLNEMGFEYKFEVQHTHNNDGRVIDELVYAAKERGEPDWTQTRRFFFDITAGYNRHSYPDPPPRPENQSKNQQARRSQQSPPKPSRMAHHAVVILRWLAFLPLAFLAAWLATRFLLFFRFSSFNNFYVAMFFMQAVHGAMIGWVGVKVAPSAKTFAIICCTLLSAIVSTAYFIKFNTVLSGLAAATGLVATVIAGYVARED